MCYVGCDSFVNVAAGFQDGADCQKELIKFHEDVDDVITFLQVLDETFWNQKEGPVWSLGGRGAWCYYYQDARV